MSDGLVFSIVKEIKAYEKKKKKSPDLIILGVVQYEELYREQFISETAKFYLNRGIDCQYILGIRMIRNSLVDGVYFAEEQVLK